jgi:uncharacterized membrane protein YphA (DoxX/SURF4 family)
MIESGRSCSPHPARCWAFAFVSAALSGKERTLDHSTRNYPGFLGAVFLVLLRISIGWHFLTEGLQKVESTWRGSEGFSAESYLRYSSGPLAPYFRGMVPDVNGLEMLDPQRLKASWREMVDRIATHYQFDDEQIRRAQSLLEESYVWADHWFNDLENEERRQKYYHDLSKVQAVERRPGLPAYERERAWDTRRALDADRRTLTTPLIERGKELADAVASLVPPEKATALGPYRPPPSFLEVANLLTMYGLCAMGACLILGFLTPLAAVCAAAFLGMIYLAMPPWPGLPENPRAEGHYWIVSKNLIEMIACLLIAVTASGHWFGLDALFFGARRRRRWARWEARQRERSGAASSSGAAVDPFATRSSN